MVPPTNDPDAAVARGAAEPPGQRFQGYLVAQLVLAAVAIAMLAFGEFGGYYYRTYPGVDVWGSVHLGSGVIASVLILAGVGGLAVAGRAALATLRAADVADAELRAREGRAMRAAGATAGLAALGALALAVTNLDNEWWLGTGFYGAFVGGLLVAGLAYLVRADVGGR